MNKPGNPQETRRIISRLALRIEKTNDRLRLLSSPTTLCVEYDALFLSRDGLVKRGFLMGLLRAIFLGWVCGSFIGMGLVNMGHLGISLLDAFGYSPFEMLLPAMFGDPEYLTFPLISNGYPADSFIPKSADLYLMWFVGWSQAILEDPILCSSKIRREIPTDLVWRRVITYMFSWPIIAACKIFLTSEAYRNHFLPNYVPFLWWGFIRLPRVFGKPTNS